MESVVKISFIERSNGAATEVKVEAGTGATKEQLEELANMAYETAIATYNQASNYAALNFRK